MAEASYKYFLHLYKLEDNMESWAMYNEKYNKMYNMLPIGVQQDHLKRTYMYRYTNTF